MLLCFAGSLLCALFCSIHMLPYVSTATLSCDHSAAFWLCCSISSTLQMLHAADATAAYSLCFAAFCAFCCAFAAFTGCLVLGSHATLHCHSTKPAFLGKVTQDMHHHVISTFTCTQCVARHRHALNVGLSPRRACSCREPLTLHKHNVVLCHIRCRLSLRRSQPPGSSSTSATTPKSAF